MPPALPSLLSLLILAASAASTQWDSLSPVTINYDSSLSSSEGIVLTGGGITVTVSAVADGTQPYLDGTGSPWNGCSPSDSQCPNGVSFQGSKLYLSDFERNECAVQLTASQPIAQFSMTDLDGFDRRAGSNQPKDFICCSVAGHWTGFVGSLGSYDASTGLARDGLGDPASDDGSGLSEARDRSRNSSLAPGDGARVRAPPRGQVIARGAKSECLYRNISDGMGGGGFLGRRLDGVVSEIAGADTVGRRLGTTDNGAATFVADEPFTELVMLYEDAGESIIRSNKSLPRG